MASENAAVLVIIQFAIGVGVNLYVTLLTHTSFVQRGLGAGQADRTKLAE